MDLKNVRLLKGVCSAVLLSGLVIASVIATQPNKVDKQPETKLETALANAETPTVAAVQARYYVQRENISSRGEKPAKPTTDFTYTVKPGDTLYDLAASYGVTVDQIQAANSLNSDKLSLNQKLLIPVSGNIEAKAALKPITVNQAKVKQIEREKPKDTQKRPVTVSRARYSGKVVGELVNWSKAQNLFSIGDTATVIDVNTGYSFKVKRKGGHNHADCEPLTTADTAVMKKLYGSWSWDRRAIVVVVNGEKIAASMAGMPHGSRTISSNGFNGHFDIHFLGSMTHGSEYTHSHKPMVDPDHQAMVRRAAGL